MWSKPVLLLAITLSLWNTNAFSYESFGISMEQQGCFANAMIGLDSVINSRLGVPPEHALELTRQANYSIVNDKQFNSEVLNIMLNAYLWRTSPHSYAIKVFYDCAVVNSFRQHANLAPDPQ